MNQHRHPHVVDILRYPLVQSADIELTLAWFRDKLDPADNNSGAGEAFEAQHRP